MLILPPNSNLQTLNGGFGHFDGIETIFWVIPRNLGIFKIYEVLFK